MIKNSWKHLIIIVGLFVTFIGMTMGIETLNKKAILAKDEKKTGKSDVAYKADTSMKQDAIKKDSSDLYLVMSINPKFMLHVHGEVIEEVFQLNDDAKIFTNKDFKGIALKEAVLKINELLLKNNYIKEDTEINVSIYDYNNIDMIAAVNLVAGFINGFTEEGLKVKSSVLEEEEKMQISSTLVNYKEKTVIDNKYEYGMSSESLLAYNKKPNILNNKNHQEENKKEEVKEEIKDEENDIVKDEELDKIPVDDNISVEEPKDEEENNNSSSSGASSSGSQTPEYPVDDSKMNKVNLEEINTLFRSDTPQVLYVGSRFKLECYRFLPVLKNVQEKLSFVTNYLDMGLNEYYDKDDILKEFALKIDIPLNDKGMTVGDYFYTRRYTPMVVVIKNNKVVGAFLGSKNTDDLSKFIEDYYFGDKDDSLIKEPEETDYDVSKMNVITLDNVNDIFNKNDNQVLFIGNKNCLNSGKMLKSLIKVQEELEYKTNYLELDKDSEDLNSDLKQLSDKMNIKVMVNGSQLLLSEYFYTEKYTPVVVIIKNKKVESALLGDNNYEVVKEFIKNNLINEEESEDLNPDIIEINTVDLSQDQVLVIGNDSKVTSNKVLNNVSLLQKEFNLEANYINISSASDNVLEDLALIMDMQVVIDNEKITLGKYLYSKKYLPIVLVIKDSKIVNAFIGNKKYDNLKELFLKIL